MGLLFSACKDRGEARGDSSALDSAYIHSHLPPSPVLTAAQSMATFQVEPGFKVQLVASDPMVNDPVALTFDNSGRIWVVEMRGYMPSISGKGEDQPSGQIRILSDSDGDGVMDQSKVFLDSLVLPRALCLIKNGLLYAEPPNLWYVPIIDDQPGPRTLVDSAYAVGGNVEHQPNGLYRALDNWIYSAKSAKRYRYRNGKWEMQKTEFRGQWGISQDNLGHLIYDDNSNQLRGDWTYPNTISNNPKIRNSAWVGRQIVDDQRVYPIRPNTGVNRGYQPAVLDDSLRLTHFTAACGPVVYRGNRFGPDFRNNAFVAEPSANLIKRDIIDYNGYKIEGKQAYRHHEFLAATDERFRPVNLYNGPDGNLYVVDMYRGLIQHITYLTDYLKNEIKSRNLDQPIGLGRIYRIMPEKSDYQKFNLPGEDPEAWLKLLSNPNGWLRDRAQQAMVDHQWVSLAPELKQMIRSSEADSLGRIHALWTLEGLQKLDFPLLQQLVKDPNSALVVQALRAYAPLVTSSTHRGYYEAARQAWQRHPTAAVGLEVISFMREEAKYQPQQALRLVKDIQQKLQPDPMWADVIMSSFTGRENEVISQLQPEDSLFRQRLETIAATKTDERSHESPFKNGKKLFSEICQACHGENGEGITSLGPPLVNSEWVLRDKHRLASVVMYGLEGPVTVNGTTYKPPQVAPLMPGLNANPDISEQDVSDILSYIRTSWGHSAGGVPVEEVRMAKEKYGQRSQPFHTDEFQ